MLSLDSRCDGMMLIFGSSILDGENAEIDLVAEVDSGLKVTDSMNLRDMGFP